MKKKQSHFCALFTKTLYSDEWKALSKSEMLLYIYIKAGRNGSNHNEISLSYSALKEIMNRSTFARSLKGLIQKGWVEKTFQGGLMQSSSKYRLTLQYDKVLKK